MKKPEILAPAGNMESLKAAVLAGADAIYLGGKSFGARSFAGNFDDQELESAIDYCHSYGIKVYVTVNTLIYEEEVPSFLNYIDFLYHCSVDAVIMQDMGMIDLVRKTYPSLPIHASTQLHIHNVTGTKFAESLGLARVVLARETSLDQIREIKKQTAIELEIFVHGALCISYSGQCLMSSLIGNRSGNRGSCAQSCRKPYDLLDIHGKKVNCENYLLSTKDLNTLEYLGPLIDMGIESLKIEGRMKRPEYVYTVTSLYRKAVDSYCNTGKIIITEEEITELKKLFHRDFTKGFLNGEENDRFTNPLRPNHLGIPLGTVVKYEKGKVTVKLTQKLSRGDGIRFLGKQDSGLTVTDFWKDGKKVMAASPNDIVEFYHDETVTKKDRVVKTTDRDQLDRLEHILHATMRKVSITGHATLQIEKPLRLAVTDGNHRFQVEGKIVERAQTTPLTEERVRAQLMKLGSTIYQWETLTVIMDADIFVDIKELNDIRRKAVAGLLEQNHHRTDEPLGQYTIEVPDFKKKKSYNVKIANRHQYSVLKDKNIQYFITEEQIEEVDKDARIIRELPRVIDHYPPCESPVLVNEWGGVSVYREYITGPFLNVTNSYTVAFLHSRGAGQVTLSYELSNRQIKDLIAAYEARYHRHPNVEVIVYGRIEAMISKYNLLKEYHLSKGYLQDHFHNRYPVVEKNGKMVIYHYQIRQLSDDFFALGVDNLRYDLLPSDVEEKQEEKR